MAKYMLSNERYEEIKRIVVRMFDKYHVSCIPISGFEIATQMGIPVIPYSAFSEDKQSLLMKMSEDGFRTYDKEGGYQIVYNERKNYGRVNHTIMHEIGHIVLGHTEDSDLAEAEVSFFAKYALAPPILINKLKLETPEQIAEVFGISYEAACYAYSYYKKRLAYGGRYCTPYEMKMLELFREVI